MNNPTGVSPRYADPPAQIVIKTASRLGVVELLCMGAADALPYVSSPKSKTPVCGSYMKRLFVIRRTSMISRLTLTTIGDFSTSLSVRPVVL